MYPHERSLVKRLKDEPFALLGINSDEDRDKTREVLSKEQITWRSWWNGGGTQGGIAEAWNVYSWPTIYVLDHEGVIRFKNESGPALDEAVDQLLKEIAAETRK